MSSVAARLERLWMHRSLLMVLLLPFSAVYCALGEIRRLAYRSGLLRQHHLPVPVVIVGNLTAGGTGKTPLVGWIASYLKSRGYRPGLVARGYGGNAQTWPQQVRCDSDPFVVGDEAVMLARSTECPMATGPDRVSAARALLEYQDCDVIVSDDGLQHYGLGRNIEIVVIDGIRRFDNGFCLPAGPLRERAARLRQANLVVVNGLAGRGEHAMRVIPAGYAPLDEPGALRPLEEFRNRKVHAVAGIGNPKRFFDSLRQARIEVVEHAFPDHHPFAPADLAFDDDLPVLMTEKDAVKCQRYGAGNRWVVPCRLAIDECFAASLTGLLESKLRRGKNS